MKIILVIYICSAIGGSCMPPIQIQEAYNDMYDCHVEGYKKSVDLLKEMGRDEVNKYEIYTKFTCEKLFET
jgi:hypothetical protein|tara:strand:+ start:296 stop:508 length:213 start_codon:yes stop_codon:yes gene_type:complete